MSSPTPDLSPAPMTTPFPAPVTPFRFILPSGDVRACLGEVRAYQRRVEGQCPACDADLYVGLGRSRIEREPCPRYVAEGYCGACHEPVGIVVRDLEAA